MSLRLLSDFPLTSVKIICNMLLQSWSLVWSFGLCCASCRGWRAESPFDPCSPCWSLPRTTTLCAAMGLSQGQGWNINIMHIENIQNLRPSHLSRHDRKGRVGLKYWQCEREADTDFQSTLRLLSSLYWNFKVKESHCLLTVFKEAWIYNLFQHLQDA